MLLIEYPKCSTCKNAERWLNDHEVEFETRDIKEENPTAEELKGWYEKSGLPLKRFFNTSGQVYKALKLKDKLPEMSEEEQLNLLASDGMLIRRPILIGADTILIGFKKEEWKDRLLCFDNE